MDNEFYSDYSFIHIFRDLTGNEIGRMEFVSDEEANDYNDED